MLNCSIALCSCGGRGGKLFILNIQQPTFYFIDKKRK
nr:MAG TPA: hypothetical protein [Caudoviricetes sp.]